MLCAILGPDFAIQSYFLFWKQRKRPDLLQQTKVYEFIVISRLFRKITSTKQTFMSERYSVKIKYR